MRTKTNDLTGAALDWAVAHCEGIDLQWFAATYAKPIGTAYGNGGYMPSTNWAQGGPIIERERVSVGTEENNWSADITSGPTGFARGFGPTPLIAAMRCYVASKLGDEIDVPEGLE